MSAGQRTRLWIGVWVMLAPAAAAFGVAHAAGADERLPGRGERLLLAQAGEPGSSEPGRHLDRGDEPSGNFQPTDEELPPLGDEPTAGGAEEEQPPGLAVPAAPPKPARETQYGVGFQLRGIFVPSWLLRLFLDAATPVNSVALGGEFVRRKGDFDIIGSIDFGFYSPPDGNYLSKGGDPAIETDYTHFDKLNVFALGVHFIKHEEIMPWLSFVWGGGVGLAFVLGDIYRASSAGCTKDNLGDINQCRPAGMNPQDPMAWINDPANRGREEDDSTTNPKLFREDGVPPVVPLIHLLVGLNFRVHDSVSIRVDGGFRNAFYSGAAVHYFF